MTMKGVVLVMNPFSSLFWISSFALINLISSSNTQLFFCMHQIANWRNWQLTGEYNGTFSSQGDSYFPQEMVEIKTEKKVSKYLT